MINRNRHCRRGLLQLLPAALSVLLLLAAGEVGAFESRVAPPNVLLICVDDLRPELGCYGVDYIHSPHIDELAARGVRFERHYVQAPTCGASRYTLLTGRYGPADNGALFARARALAGDTASRPDAMPAWFRKNGYTTVSVGKVSHHPGGRGGSDWNNDDQPEMPFSWDRHLMPSGPWLHPRGAMHGLAHGEIRVKAGEMDVFQSTDGPDSIYPDGLITEAALDQLRQLSADDKPFFLAVGLIRPHLPFGAPAAYMQHYHDVKLPPIPHPARPSGRTTWHGSGEFMKYNRWKRNPNTDPEFAESVRRHYAACVTYADAQVGRIVNELRSLEQHENTVIVLWGDHGWHLGEHAIWGKHSLFEESLRSPLIICRPDGEAAGTVRTEVVETVDVFPTLCQMTDVPVPDACVGDSLLEAPDVGFSGAVSYKGRIATLRSDRYRLILHSEQYAELYDHESAAGETLNVADQHPEIVQELTVRLRNRRDGSNENVR